MNAEKSHDYTTLLKRNISLLVMTYSPPPTRQGGLESVIPIYTEIVKHEEPKRRK